METNSRNNEIATLMNSLSLARNEINNLRQQLVSLKHSHRKDCENIRQSISSWNCGKCTTNNDFPTPSSSTIPVPTEVVEFPHKFIGYVETGFSTKRAVPRQPGILSQSQGVVRIDNRVLTNPQHALEGLEQFSHMWILFFFHANESNHIRAKVAPPRLNGTRMGVFATRSPHRPSPIGLSLVKIDSVDDNCIFFSGVDMLDGTPVLDVKPFIPQYDSPYPAQLSRPPARLHWHRLHRDSSTDREEGELELQDRLLIGEANSSGDLLDGAALSDASLIDINARVLDGMDSDEVFIHPQSAQNVPDLEISYLDRSPTRSASQREAPEGSEGPPSPSQLGNIRIANWVTNPPVARLTVQFAEDCLTKLQRITESQAAASSIQSTISSILSEDPRSVYIRQRYGEEPYSCAIEGLSVTCFFDDTAHICLVTDAEKISAELLEGDNDES